MTSNKLFAVLFSSSLFVASLLTPTATTVAEISVSLCHQIQIPDSIYTDDFSIVDMDDDGEAELLLENSAIIARFSLFRQQTLDYFVKPVSDQPRKFACGFVDEDPGLDFFEVIMIGIYEPDSNRLMAVPYMSGESWAAGDSVELLRFANITETAMPEPPYVATLKQWGLGHQYFADDDLSHTRLWGDIRFDYTTYDYYEEPQFEYGTYTFSLTYSYLPGESEAQTGVTLPLSVSHYTLTGDNGPFSIVLEPWAHWSRKLKSCWGERQTKGYQVKIYPAPDYSINHSLSSLCSCTWPVWSDEFCSSREYLRLKAHAAGDFLPASPGNELAVFESHDAWNDDGCSCFEYHLRCFDLSDPESLTSEWDLILGESETDIEFMFVEPEFPGLFFSFAHSKLISRNADGGAVMDSSAAVTGQAGEIIAYRSLETGGSNYIIFRDDNLLSLYGFDYSTEVADDPATRSLPASFALGEPYPNPFNMQLTIPVSLDHGGNLTVLVYNLLGQRVASVFDGPSKAGNLTLSWNGKDDSGQEVSSGLYLIRAATNMGSGTVKAVLLK